MGNCLTLGLGVEITRDLAQGTGDLGIPRRRGSRTKILGPGTQIADVGHVFLWHLTALLMLRVCIAWAANAGLLS